MIISGVLASQPAPANLDSVPDQGGSPYSGRVMTSAKQYVSPELSKKLHVVYRCANGIVDDISTMPLKQYVRSDNRTGTVAPDASMRNMAYLLQVSPNRWMTPSVFIGTVMRWLIFWGNGLIWAPPPPAQRELFILPTNLTHQKMNPKTGDLWYMVLFPNGEKKYIPAVEIMHIMINSTNGMWGRSVLEYARDTVGLRLGMSATKEEIQGNGLNPAAYVKVNGFLDKRERQQYRDAYMEVLAGPENTGSLVVFDNKVTEFMPITMKPSDAQFLEQINATDREIANFFKYPEYKLNMGKQSYQSNEQQDLDYLKSTLDPYLVQWEQAARLRWLSESDQANGYFKFTRDSVLRTDAKKRAEIYQVSINSGTMNPNEARGLEDRDSYPLGDKFWMTRNNAEIGANQNANPQ
jgi:HK97 family phage portal protein